jgi:hypothetical protein
MISMTEFRALLERAMGGERAAWHDLWRRAEPLIWTVSGKWQAAGPLCKNPDERREIVLRVMERLRDEDFRRLRAFAASPRLRGFEEEVAPAIPIFGNVARPRRWPAFVAGVAAAAVFVLIGLALLGQREPRAKSPPPAVFRQAEPELPAGPAVTPVPTVTPGPSDTPGPFDTPAPSVTPAPVRSSAPKPSQVLPPEHGTLVVICDPRCDSVRVAGRELGASPPAVRRALPAGSHSVVLRFPAGRERAPGGACAGVVGAF